MSLLSFVTAVLLLSLSNAQIMFGFYKFVCPNAEYVVYNEMVDILSVAPSLAGPLLRMHYHDCFVKGCDASILLNPTSNNVTEKVAAPNLSIRGYGVFDRIKEKLEETCPGIVSCADIVALVARDVVAL
ncbi:peroxidase 1-like, partial [Phalaenopsis equestris]